MNNVFCGLSAAQIETLILICIINQAKVQSQDAEVITNLVLTSWQTEINTFLYKSRKGT